MPIRLRSLKTDINDKSNVFFKNIVAENSESLISNRWNVTLSRTQNINNSSFKLSTYYKEKKLHDTAVKFESDQLETTVSVSIPLSNLIANEENIVLRWQVENLDSNSNIITVDDYYFQPVQVSLSKVLLLSLPYGELTLEDPSFHVEKTLEVLGFKIRRIDQSIRSNLKSFNDYPLWIVSGGREGMYSRWCPKEVGPNTQLILSPESTQVSYKELCKCVGYHSSEGEQSYNQLPIYCEDVNVRDQFVEILRAQGGKQIGGEIGKLTTSLAWSFKSAGSNLLVTTLPIRPSRMTGITYNNMPIILKFIIDYLGLSTGGKDKDKLDSKALNLNVPIGESQLVYQNTNQLPALLHISDANEQVLLDNQKEDATVEPLIDIAYWIVLIIFLVEAIYYFIKSYRARNTLIVFALLGFGAGELKAVELVTVGRPKISPKLAAVLKNEVEGRTSITFSNKINFHPSLNEKIYKNPMIWTSSLAAISGKSGELNEDLRLWLRRGGLLVVEGRISEKQLGKLSSSMIGGSWQVVAPDHEIMVSFHLLNSLPDCFGEVWKYYSFDKRVAILNIPYNFLDSIQNGKPRCVSLDNYKEQSMRIFVNLLMVALTTDYKKDQVHLPEILKRLR